MNYIIFDLEFNQEFKDKSLENTDEKHNNNPKLTFEIIQIGAIKINDNFEKISTFSSLIKPNVHIKVHPYVHKMTGITEDQLQSKEEFPSIYERLVEFIGNPEDSVLCVWGIVDIKELLRNIKFYNLSTDVIPKKYIDVQHHASKFFGTKYSSRIGLKNAIELLNLKIEGDFHDAFNDAYYTCEVFKSIYSPTMKPLIYNDTNRRKVKDAPHKKYKVNMNGVYQQFEKMYSRQLSNTEKDMIQLAYTMGRTHQFLVKKSDKE